MSLTLVPLGVGDAFSACHYSACLALEHRGHWLLLDCPHPIRKMMREASRSAGVELDIDRISGVVLTHLHADHSSGLAAFTWFSHFVLGRRVRLLAHPSVSEHLWHGHLEASMSPLLPRVGAKVEYRSFEDYFQLVALDQEDAVPCGPFWVECRPTVHHVPTTALRVRAGGRTLGYSADTTFDPELIAWLAEADLVLHETGFGVHARHAELASLPAELRARMRLVHFPDQLHATDMGIEPLAEGHRYAV